jgi:hypothetical protein
MSKSLKQRRAIQNKTANSYSIYGYLRRTTALRQKRSPWPKPFWQTRGVDTLIGADRLLLLVLLGRAPYIACK